MSLRWNRPDSSRLLHALIISLLLHVLIWGIYKLETRYHILEAFHLPRRLSLVKPREVDPLQVAKKIEEETRREIPLTFIDVNPDAATAEAPENTPYYSMANSRAANPKADKDTHIPKIEGAQDKVLRTENVPPTTTAKPMQPAVAAKPDSIPQNQAPPAARPPDAQPDVKTLPEQKARASVPAGDLALGKPVKSEELKPSPEEGTAPRSRPRTLAEARARLAQAGRLAGEQVKQDGGTRRQALSASFDVKATPFGAYDAAIIYAVQNRWYYLLDSGGFARDRSGRVVLEFKLHYDGRVTELKVLENSVDELLSLLCQKAILDPAPFERWPADLRRLVGADFRVVTFTFYYN